MSFIVSPCCRIGAAAGCLTVPQAVCHCLRNAPDMGSRATREPPCFSASRYNFCGRVRAPLRATQMGMRVAFVAFPSGKGHIRACGHGSHRHAENRAEQ